MMCLHVIIPRCLKSSMFGVLFSEERSFGVYECRLKNVLCVCIVDNQNVHEPLTLFVYLLTYLSISTDP